MFTPENQAKFDEIVRRYPVKRSALLPALHLLQEQHGWLTTRSAGVRGEAAGPHARAGPRHRDLLLDVPLQAVREDAHRGLHEPLLRAGRRGRADRVHLPEAGRGRGRDDRGREVHRQPRGVPGRLRRRSGGAGQRRVAGERDRGRPRPRARRRDGLQALRLAEDRGRDRHPAQRLQEGLGLARDLQGGRRVREAQGPSHAQAGARSSRRSRSRACAAAAAPASRPGSSGASCPRTTPSRATSA